MSMRELTTIVLWLLGGLAALAFSAVWVIGAEDGKVSGFALVPFMWSVALLAGFVHHLKASGLVARTANFFPRARLSRQPV
jgi:hypothetical protein